MSKKLKVTRAPKTSREILDLLKGVNWLKPGEAAVEVVDKDGNRRWERVPVKWRTVKPTRKPPKRKRA